MADIWTSQLLLYGRIVDDVFTERGAAQRAREEPLAFDGIVGRVINPSESVFRGFFLEQHVPGWCELHVSEVAGEPPVAVVADCSRCEGGRGCYHGASLMVAIGQRTTAGEHLNGDAAAFGAAPPAELGLREWSPNHASAPLPSKLEAWFEAAAEPISTKRGPPPPAGTIVYELTLEPGDDPIAALVALRACFVPIDGGWKSKVLLENTDTRAPVADRVLKHLAGEDEARFRRLSEMHRWEGHYKGFRLPTSTSEKRFIVELIDAGLCYIGGAAGGKPIQLARDAIAPPLMWVSDASFAQALVCQNLWDKRQTLIDVGGELLLIDMERATASRVSCGIADFQRLLAMPAIEPADVPAVRARLRGIPRYTDLPMPREFDVRNIRDAPSAVARILLFGAGPMRGLGGVAASSSGLRELQIQLRYHYGEHLVQAGSREASIARQVGSTHLRIWRDVLAESSFERRLNTVGFTHAYSDRWRSSQYYGIAITSASVIPLHEALEKLGFVVELDESLGLTLVDGDLYNEAEEVAGGGWFDVEVGVLVDGKRVSLVPVLAQVLANPRFRSATLAPDEKLIIDIGAGRLVRFDAQRLRSMLSPLLEWFENAATSRARSARLPRAALLISQRGEDGKGLIDLSAWPGLGPLQKLAAQFESSLQEAVPPTPAGFVGKLRPYQTDGTQWLNVLGSVSLGGVLADDMGLGKTVQLLAHLVMAKARGALKHPALIVMPTSLVKNWSDEAARFAPDLRVLILHGPDRAPRFAEVARHDLVLTTYALLWRDLKQLAVCTFSLAIFDEAQALKNPASQGAKAARGVPATHRIAVTGTPLENNLEELWSLFDLVLPGLLGNQAQFRTQYRTPIEKHGDGHAQQRLNRLIKRLMLRRTKDSVARELPPKTEMVRSVELYDAQRELYESVRAVQHAKVKAAIEATGLAQAQIVVLDAILKLRQVCCDPRLVNLAAAKKIESSAKLDMLREMLPELVAEGRQILVFSQFTKMLDIIEKMVQDEIKLGYTKLTGATSKRGKVIERFQRGEVPIFLLSLKAGGVGLNLTAADAVIHYDPWWNPAAENQASDRAHRIGQTRPVFVYKLICANTIEERVQVLQARKAGLSDAVLSGGTTSGVKLSQADVDEMFAGEI